VYLHMTITVCWSVAVQEKYDSTLLDSRLVIFEKHAGNDAKLSCSGADSQQQISVASESVCVRDVQLDSGATVARSAADDRSTCIMASSSDVLWSAGGNEQLSDIDEQIVEFLLSLFWVLESKRLDRSSEHVDNLMLLTAPFEQRKDSFVADVDSRYLSFTFFTFFC